MLLLYVNPHAERTLMPSGSNAFGTHRYRCGVGPQDLRDGQRGNFLNGHGAVARELSVLGRHLAGAIYEAPRWIG